MLRDFRNRTSRKALSLNVEKIRELVQAKAELEARIVQDITNFEHEHRVVIDHIRFSRQVTKTPETIYTEISLLLE